MRTIKVPAGIGDNIWLLQKLVHTGERFHFELPDGKPQRGHQIFELLPEVAASYTYVPGLSYKILSTNNIQRFRKSWEQIDADNFYLSANEHLEKGHRLEKFLPDLPTAYRINWFTTYGDMKKAQNLLPWGTKEKPAKPDYIGIYCSSYAGSRNWGTWGRDEWVSLICEMKKRNPGFIFVIIGARWDADLTVDVMSGLEFEGVEYINTIGEPLPVVVEILKRLDYFIGFPSGLSILNETLGKRTFMFYAEQIKGIMGTWADPARIENKDCTEMLFCEPEEVVKYIFEDYKLLDKL